MALKFKYMQTTNIKQYSKIRRVKSAIKNIVVHGTSNKNKGANALAHKKYLDGATRLGSAHYYVDDKEIIQTIGDTMVAWAVGDNQGKGTALNGVTNSNSISIEICENSDGNFEQAYLNAVELTKNLMLEFNISEKNVCRHYDVSRKNCPASLSGNNWQKWWEFKELIKQPRKLIIDLSKDSTAVEVKEEGEKEMTDYDKEFEEAKKLGIIQGNDKGEFRENEAATKKEVAVMVLRGIKIAKGENI